MLPKTRSRNTKNEADVSRKIKFTKQYKPIKLGDGPDPGTVEGHRNAMITMRLHETRCETTAVKPWAGLQKRGPEDRCHTSAIHFLSTELGLPVIRKCQPLVREVCTGATRFPFATFLQTQPPCRVGGFAIFNVVDTVFTSNYRVRWLEVH